MINKVINLSDKQPNIIPNTEESYSDLLYAFIKHFEDDFNKFEYFEDMFEFAINAWNIGNMKLIVSEVSMNQFHNPFEDDGPDSDLLKKMVDYKVSHFKEHTNFIVNFEIDESTVSKEPILRVISQDESSFLQSIGQMVMNEEGIHFSDLEEEEDEEDKENYINRIAFTLKPKQPFIDWFHSISSEELIDKDFIKEPRIYLIHEDEIAQEWLKKNFDKMFTFELNSWYTDKKKWPKKRSYKMFNEWFQVEIANTVYDFENESVYKS